MSISIASIEADAKANARIPIAVKYQTRTIREIRIAIARIAQIRFARFTKRPYISLEKLKQCPDEKQSAEGACVSGSIGPAAYGICIANQKPEAHLYCKVKLRRDRHHRWKHFE
jgi:hypothetical protein